MARARLILAAALLGGAAIPLPAAAQSLEEAIAAALESSPALAAARAREDAADAGIAQARAEGNPSASIQGQIGAGWIDPQGFFGLTGDDVFPRAVQVGGELPLYTGGRVAAALAQAEAGRGLAAVGADGAERMLRLQVVEAYVEAASAAETVRSYTALLTALTEVRRHARLRFEAGAGTSTEVAQAEARLAEAEAALAGAQGARAAAEARLTRLAGRPIAPQLPLPVPLAQPMTREEAVARALATNPAVEQARRAVELAEASVSGARAEVRPAVAAYAEASHVRDQFFPGYRADSASVGLRARWQLYSGGRVSAATDRARAELAAAQSDLAAAEQVTEIRVLGAYEQLAAARAALSASEARVAATEAALRSTRLEVQVGALPQLAELDARREAIEAATARIRASGQVLLAQAMLDTLVGPQ